MKEKRQTQKEKKSVANYSKPRLVFYGSVRDLTMGSSNYTNDPGGSNNGGTAPPGHG